ncbi:hypothetical protein ACWC2K_18835 [Streptomyces chattanoogensis]|uniref:hypothetical protein n=1 Tax=Streptomyces chattanoogensis TaxID=66876 RepID=UPI0036AA105A
MTDRAGSRWARGRTALTAFAVVTVLAAAGVWISQSADRASAVGAAPKTAAVQGVKVDGKGSGGLPVVRDCGIGDPAIKPQVITLSCADAGMVATAISWDRYDSREAEGTGVVQVQKTAAGAGTDSGFPATFRLYGVRTVGGARAFTGLEVRYEGSTPLGVTTEMYKLT